MALSWDQGFVFIQNFENKWFDFDQILNILHWYWLGLD